MSIYRGVRGNCPSTMIAVRVLFLHPFPRSGSRAIGAAPRPRLTLARIQMRARRTSMSRSSTSAPNESHKHRRAYSSYCIKGNPKESDIRINTGRGAVSVRSVTRCNTKVPNLRNAVVTTFTGIPAGQADASSSVTRAGADFHGSWPISWRGSP
jgi:hypothetical protein